VRALYTAAFVLLVSAAAAAQMGGMPDAKQMSGTPLPMAEMTPGTVSVRVVRGSMANVVAKHQVELTIDGATKSAQTDDAGRATFENLRIGATVKLRTVVGSETLESQEFQVPPQGGVRLMLVATDPNAEKQAAEDAKLAQAAAQPGTVALGSQSRIHVELGEEAADVYYLLDIVNTAKVPVQLATPFVIELPEGSSGSSILEGSNPKATAAGRIVRVEGPFAPGATTVQAAFRLPYSGGRVQFSQAFPARFEAPVLSVTKKTPAISLQSTVFHEPREVPNEGQLLLVAHAKATPASTPMDVRIDGVPSHPAWPRVVALTLAAVILAVGGWATATSRRRVAERAVATKQLQSRREKLLGELATLEQRRRSGAIAEGQYTRRRADIIEELERVYSDLDAGAAA
jgi:hypothetical protein